MAIFDVAVDVPKDLQDLADVILRKHAKTQYTKENVEMVKNEIIDLIRDRINITVTERV